MKILKYPNPHLVRPTKEIDFSKDLNDEFYKSIEMMQLILENTPSGIALAANQVGLQGRFFIIKKEFAKEQILPCVIVNPLMTRIHSSPQAQSIEEEGCLSFPGIFIPIQRWTDVGVECRSIEGADIKLKLHGLTARIFQHEIDHLDGKVFVDKLDRISKFQIIGKMMKRN